MAGVPHHVLATGEPDQSPSGRLPFLLFADGTTVTDVLSYSGGLAIEVAGEGEDCGGRQRPCDAQVAILLEKYIRPAVLAVLWGLCGSASGRSAEGAARGRRQRRTRDQYGGGHVWPISAFVRRAARSSAMAQAVQGSGAGSRRPPAWWAELVGDGARILRSLSDMLGDRPSFSSDAQALAVDARAFAVDAQAFALFAMIMHGLNDEQGRRSDLTVALETCANLRALVQRHLRALAADGDSSSPDR